MKVLKIIAYLAICPLTVVAWSVNFKSHEQLPYKYNYKKCIFRVQVDRWIKHNGRNVLPIQATLNNTSDDTLKYEMMTYYMLAFQIKSNCLEYEYAHEDILKNIPEYVVIPPHQSKSYSFNLVKKDSVQKVKGNLKVGFFLVFPKYSAPSIDYYIHFEDPFAYLVDNHGNVMPHDRDLNSRIHLLWSDKINLNSN